MDKEEILDARIQIPLSSFYGPFNLEATLDCEQCPSDIYFKENDWVKTFVRINGDFLKVRLRQKVKYITGAVVPSRGRLSKERPSQIKVLLLKQFTADYNLPDFYKKFGGDKYMSKVIKACEGLRLMQDWNLFWRFIEAVYTQNISVIQIRKIDSLIRKNFGKKIDFRDEDSFCFFPSAKDLASVSQFELERKCKLGYRAEYVACAVSLINQGKVSLEKLAEIPTPEARDILVRIKGFGPKVADIFLVYGLGRVDAFPMDVWLRQALEREYFGTQKQPEKKLRDFALGYFGKHAAIAHLYMFYFERKKKLGQTKISF
jgi:3-methyladenine DNA glycosylase/8-oxoguanine DNA glycosylase